MKKKNNDKIKIGRETFRVIDESEETGPGGVVVVECQGYKFYIPWAFWNLAQEANKGNK